jgi:hypothetical protein
MRFLNGLLKPQMQADFANALPGTGLVTKSSAALVKPEVLKVLPDVSSPNVAVNNDDWWADNYLKVAPRFKEWLLTG